MSKNARILCARRTNVYVKVPSWSKTEQRKSNSTEYSIDFVYSARCGKLFK